VSATPSTSIGAVDGVADSVASGKMARQSAAVIYVLVMIGIVVGVDVLFFRHQLWARLLVNVGIVLVFLAFYLRFLKRP
jgi:hypothetical protein